MRQRCLRPEFTRRLVWRSVAKRRCRASASMRAQEDQLMETRGLAVVLVWQPHRIAGVRLEGVAVVVSVEFLGVWSGLQANLASIVGAFKDARSLFGTGGAGVRRGRPGEVNSGSLRGLGNGGACGRRSQLVRGRGGGVRAGIAQSRVCARARIEGALARWLARSACGASASSGPAGPAGLDAASASVECVALFLTRTPQGHAGVSIGKFFLDGLSACDGRGGQDTPVRGCPP